MLTAEDGAHDTTLARALRRRDRAEQVGLKLLDKDVDGSITPVTQPGVEPKQGWHAGSNNFLRVGGNLFLQATAA